jgi:hypothetical protein
MFPEVGHRLKRQQFAMGSPERFCRIILSYGVLSKKKASSVETPERLNGKNTAVTKLERDLSTQNGSISQAFLL